MHTPLDPDKLEKRRHEIRTELASIGDLRPGSLMPRYRKCGKPNCHCATEEGGGHGPSWSLTRRVDGKTVTKIIPSHAVEQTKQQIAECQRLRELTRELVEVSEDICEAKLTATTEAEGGGKKRLQEAFDAELVAEITALIGPGAVDGLDFEAIETAVRRRTFRIAARAVEQRLNADRSDHVGPSLRCTCGNLARYAGRRPKSFQTALGTMTLERAYYHCEACHAGFCPRDRALGLHATSLSAATTRMVGLAAAMVSFAEASELMRELAGISVDPKQVERSAEALGREIAQDERRVVEAEPPKAPTLYLGLDGTGVPMRATEVEGRPGKQPDGSAKTREVKLVTVWTAEGTDKKGVPMRDLGSVSYSAALESAASRDTDHLPSEFAQRVDREARRRGFDQAKRRVVLGDGAPWIWNLSAELFPGAIQIVDIFHAKGHLWDVAKAIYGAGSDLSEQWAKKRRDELDKGRIDDILEALRVHAQTNDEARKCLGYVLHNQKRMHYPQFRAQGLCVSSGVVEAGCKVVVGTRLKRAGMHWTVAGAGAIIALRCCKLSGRFEDFWERRSAAGGYVA